MTTTATDREILFLRDRFPWMGLHSGYDLLFEAITRLWPGDLSSVFRTRSRLRNFLYTPISLLSRPRTPFYKGECAAAELEAMRRARHDYVDLVHIAYLENDMRLFRDRRPGDRFRRVATSHQPAEWWRTRHRHPEILEGLDALFVMSHAQVEYFEKWLPGRVHFIPHGIDSGFFCPAPIVEGEDRAGSDVAPRCVFSGKWLRDRSTLRTVIERALTRHPDLHFDMIVPVAKRKHPDFMAIARHDRVVWHAGVSDESLREVYRNARMIFLPLLDCTANNALLEGMACGLPVVTTDVGGMRDYTDESFADRLPAGDAEGLLEAVLRLAEDRDLAAERGRLARAHAVRNLGWDESARRTIAVYEELIG